MSIVLIPMVASAQIVLGTEDAGGGLVVQVPNSTILIASDGESGFDPFGVGADTSDGIQFAENWVPDPSFTLAFNGSFWQQAATSNTWYMPTNTPLGSENEPIGEPAGKWYLAGSIWAAPASYVILEPDSSVSDIITLDNTGPGGFAAITFDSVEAPEPSSLALGAMGVLVVARRRRRPEPAAV